MSLHRFKIINLLLVVALVAAACTASNVKDAATVEPVQLSAPRCDYGAPHPNAPPALSQFDFLIGDFSITLHAWRNGAWTPPRPGPGARWNGWYGLGGMVIVDEWFDPDPSYDIDATRGVNVRLFDTEQNVWKMMWVATGGKQVQDLRAEMRDGVLTMWQVYPERPGFEAEFHRTDADRWRRVQYTLDDSGNRVPQFKLEATRVPCDSA